MESLCIMATSSRIFHTSGKNKSFKYMYLFSQTMHWKSWLPLHTDLNIYYVIYTTVDIIIHCASILNTSLPDCLKKKSLNFIEKYMLKNV